MQLDLAQRPRGLAAFAALGLSLSASAGTYDVVGAGGSVPDAVGAVWPNTLPALFFSDTVYLPCSAGTIDRIDLTLASHTWAGDLQVVLWDPNNVGHNLVHRIGKSGSSAGSDCDLVGTYSIALGGAAWPACSGSGAFTPGTYAPYTGPLPVAPGIVNSNMVIPVFPNQPYRLEIYDWLAADIGDLIEWHIVGTTGSMEAYCLPNMSSGTCQTTIRGVGSASATAATPFEVYVDEMPGSVACRIFVGLNPTLFQVPWGAGGTSDLCIKPPLISTGTQITTGFPLQCNGQAYLNFNTWADPTWLPYLFQCQEVRIQCWYRDPQAPKTSNMSDALKVILGP